MPRGGAANCRTFWRYVFLAIAVNRRLLKLSSGLRSSTSISHVIYKSRDLQLQEAEDRKALFAGKKHFLGKFYLNKPARSRYLFSVVVQAVSSASGSCQFQYAERRKTPVQFSASQFHPTRQNTLEPVPVPEIVRRLKGCCTNCPG